MKFIIKEDRLFELAIKWLDDNYGDLELVKLESDPDRLFFVKGNMVVLNYYPDTSRWYVNFRDVFEVIDNYFSINNHYITSRIISDWIESKTNSKLKDRVGISLTSELPKN